MGSDALSNFLLKYAASGPHLVKHLTPYTSKIHRRCVVTLGGSANSKYIEDTMISKVYPYRVNI